MTDDEAFLRTILDAPGDQAPRLVYADWLDERNDPRGAYLRAEVKSGRLKGPAVLAAERQLLAHAAGLDPVWVARVSRPPYGVCCDRVRFLETGPSVSLMGLDSLAVRLGITLPVDYRAFLLNWNGGTPDPNHFQLHPDSGPGDYVELERFFSLYPRSVEPTGGSWLDDLEESARVLKGNGFPNDGIEYYLPIATAGDHSYLLLGIREPFLGEIAYVTGYTHGSTEARVSLSVAHTFAWFLALLKDHDPEWVRLIWSGKVAEFVRWLNMGGDPDAFYHRAGESAVEVAASCEQWEMVAELLRRGADVSEAARERLDRNGPNSVRRLVGTRPGQ